MIVVDDSQELFGKDGIERDKETTENTKDSSPEAKVQFSLGTNGKANNDYKEAQHGTEGSGGSQKDTSEEYVEYNGKRPCHIVEGDFHVFQTKIVGDNHADKDETQRQDSPGSRSRKLGLGELRKEGWLGSRTRRRRRDIVGIDLAVAVRKLFGTLSALSSSPTNEGGNDALIPSHKERSIDRD